MNRWPLIERLTPIPIMDGVIETTIRNRTQKTYEQITVNINSILYGDDHPPRKYTRRERLLIWFRLYRQRIGDAWMVLTGKADIGGDCY